MKVSFVVFDMLDCYFLHMKMHLFFYLRVFIIYVYLLFTDHVWDMYMLSHILEKKTQNVSIDISNKV